MSRLRAVDVKEILARAAEALSTASGKMLKLGNVEVLSNDDRRNFIARATQLVVLTRIQFLQLQ